MDSLDSASQLFRQTARVRQKLQKFQKDMKTEVTDHQKLEAEEMSRKYNWT